MSGMVIIQRRDIIRGVRERWLTQYANYRDDYTFRFNGAPKTVGEIRRALANLDLEACSVEDVDAAIGTTGWAENKCDECDGDFAVLLRIGQEPDYEARWLDLCAGCLGKARDLLVSTEPQP